MALIYVSHEYSGNPRNIFKAKRITRDLQINDLENAYVCPWSNFSFLDIEELTREERTDLHLDLLSVCDVLLVASEADCYVNAELEFAELVGMEVRYIED